MGETKDSGERQSSGLYPEARLEPMPNLAGRLTPDRERKLPLDSVHVFWLAGMSCDGCTVSASGATNPSIEDLQAGTIPNLPKMVLHHYVLSTESGEEFVDNYRKAWKGELESPYVVVYEGSIPDERIAERTGGYWASMGTEPDPEKPEGQRPVPTSEWLKRMAPGAAAVVAIGTCATWGGIPASSGNPTGSMSLMDFLGKDFRSSFGLPVINVPGCAPQGDNFTETVAAIFYYLQGIGPIPEIDALGRPAWLFAETVHRGCTRGSWYEEGTFAKEYGDKECLVELGCWGPVVNCNIVKRGAIGHVGGCMEAGGPCIGCTMPGFPDKFEPFYTEPPGSVLSTTATRITGSVIRPLRKLTQNSRNREPRWDEAGAVPSGWSEVSEPGPLKKVEEWLYRMYQGTRGEMPGRKGKDRDWGGTRPGNEDDYPVG